jgi:hypothetical protein
LKGTSANAGIERSTGKYRLFVKFWTWQSLDEAAAGRQANVKSTSLAISQSCVEIGIFARENRADGLPAGLAS